MALSKSNGRRPYFSKVNEAIKMVLVLNKPTAIVAPNNAGDELW